MNNQPNHSNSCVLSHKREVLFSLFEPPPSTICSSVSLTFLCHSSSYAFIYQLVATSLVATPQHTRQIISPLLAHPHPFSGTHKRSLFQYKEKKRTQKRECIFFDGIGAVLAFILEWWRVGAATSNKTNKQTRSTSVQQRSKTGVCCGRNENFLFRIRIRSSSFDFRCSQMKIDHRKTLVWGKNDAKLYTCCTLLELSGSARSLACGMRYTVWHR
jgi:hypothetical protein